MNLQDDLGSGTISTYVAESETSEQENKDGMYANIPDGEPQYSNFDGNGVPMYSNVGA